MRVKSSLILALALLAGALAPAQAASPKAPQREITETKDRVTAEDMEALVARPIALARKGDMVAADAALERLLEERRKRFGPDSIEVADTLSSFMVLLFLDDRKAEALSYGPRTLDATRRAWGSDNLEYALVLNDLVQMDYKTHEDAVGPEAEAALREVYRIRYERLGQFHKETIATLIYLGNIMGLRSRTGGDIAKAKPAIATLNLAITQSEEHPQPGLNDNLWARMTLATVYARNGAVAPAMAAYDKMIEVAKSQDPTYEIPVSHLADALKESGHNAEAEAFIKPYLEAQQATEGAKPDKAPEGASPPPPGGSPP